MKLFKKSNKKTLKEKKSTIDQSEEKPEPKKLKEDFVNPSVAPTLKSIEERLHALYIQQQQSHDITRKAFFDKISHAQFNLAGNVIEKVNLHQILENKCMLSLSSSLFLSTTLESLTLMWTAHNKYNNDIRKSFQNNKNLTYKLAELSEEVSYLETTKKYTLDEVSYYKRMWDICSEYVDEDYSKLENEVWDLLLTMPTDLTTPIQLTIIDNNLTPDTVSQLESQIKNYLVDGRTNEKIALIILNLGKRCLYLNAPEVALNVIRQSLILLKKFVDSSSLKYVLLPFAEAFAFHTLNKNKEAIKILLSVYQDLDKVNLASRNEKAYIDSHVGYFLIKWKEKDTGFNILENCCSLLKHELPNSESLWTKYSNLIARLYNECGKTDLSFIHLSNILNFFQIKYHGPITIRNKPIYMIASESKHVSNASAQLMGTLSTQLGYLPEATIPTLKELVVTFAIQGNIDAVKIVEQYITDLSSTFKDIPYEEELNQIDQQSIMNVLKYKIRGNSTIKKKIVK